MGLDEVEEGVNCGCGGNIDEFYTSCSHCGRLHCVRERVDSENDNCLHCRKPLVEPLQDLKDPAYLAAVAHVSRLLGFQRNAQRRTEVLDNTADWYSASVDETLSEEQRQNAQFEIDQYEKMRNDILISRNRAIDMDTKTFVDTRPQRLAELDKRYQDRFSKFLRGVTIPSIVQAEWATAAGARSSEPESSLYDELVSRVGGNAYVGRLPSAESSDEAILRGPVEDDQGMTLTLHQPWASFVVEGIKQVEGRAWSTDYCGPLWIHAASKNPNITDYDNLVRNYKDKFTEFPIFGSLPTSKLIGRVNLDKVIDRDVEELDNDENNSSKFLFLLSNPQRLPDPIPMPGKDRLWTLHPTTLDYAAYYLSSK